MRHPATLITMPIPANYHYYYYYKLVVCHSGTRMSLGMDVSRSSVVSRHKSVGVVHKSIMMVVPWSRVLRLKFHADWHTTNMRGLSQVTLITWLILSFFTRISVATYPRCKRKLATWWQKLHDHSRVQEIHNFTPHKSVLTWSCFGVNIA